MNHDAQVQKLIDVCIAAVIEADNGDYYQDGLADVEPIIEALAPLGVTFGPEISKRQREVRRDR